MKVIDIGLGLCNIDIKYRERDMRKVLGIVLSVLVVSVIVLVASCSNDVGNQGESGGPLGDWITPTTYKGFDIIDGEYSSDEGSFPFKYSDGFFEVDPKYYSTHMATMSQALAHASVTKLTNGGTKNPDDAYRHAPDRLIDILSQIGFYDYNYYVIPDYYVKPTPETIGAVIGYKEIDTVRKGHIAVISITIRSGGYEQEWASNVTLGDRGEAAGFAKAADKVLKECLDDIVFTYLEGHLKPFIEEGRLVFWVQGYSRGGAVANLLSKRLIDRYQPMGNEVYAYCLEAPAGGVLSAENPDRDYRSIHNVINQNDLVPYVAPVYLGHRNADGVDDGGFKRYGVDHWLWGDLAHDPDDLIEDMYQSGHMMDNTNYALPQEAQLKLVRGQLSQILPSSKVEANMPYEIVSYHLKINKNDCGITKRDKQWSTSSFLFDFMNGLVYDGKGYFITRKGYVDTRLQAALQNLTVHIFSGGSLPTDYKTLIDIKDIIILVINDFIINQHHLNEITISTGNIIDDIWGWITGNKDVKIELNFDSSTRDDLAKHIAQVITSKPEVLEKFEGYPGDLYNDLYTLLKFALIGVRDIDTFITMAMNVVNVLQNHQFITTLAILRSYDSWFEPTVTGE